MVELEEDLELVVIGVAGPHYVRPEIAGKFGGGAEDSRDPLLELTLLA
ncbi:MAG TPA: hypothetical protein VJ827_08170 [Rubrobacter sp.]|nr:hypothetical protein [Rubrobacter sp.]